MLVAALLAAVVAVPVELDGVVELEVDGPLEATDPLPLTDAEPESEPLLLVVDEELLLVDEAAEVSRALSEAIVEVLLVELGEEVLLVEELGLAAMLLSLEERLAV